MLRDRALRWFLPVALLQGCGARTIESTQCSEEVFCPAGTDCLGDRCVAPSCADYGDGIGCVLDTGLGECSAGACIQLASTMPDGGAQELETVLLSGRLKGEVRQAGGIVGLVDLGGVQVSVVNEPSLGATLSATDGAFSLAVPQNRDVVLRLESAGYAPAASRIFSVGKRDVSVDDPLVLVSEETWAQLRQRGGLQTGPIVMVSYVNLDNAFGLDTRSSFVADPPCAQGPGYWNLEFSGPEAQPGPAPYATFAGCGGRELSLSASHMTYDECTTDAPENGEPFRVRTDLGLDVFAGWFRCY